MSSERMRCCLASRQPDDAGFNPYPAASEILLPRLPLPQVARVVRPPLRRRHEALRSGASLSHKHTKVYEVNGHACFPPLWVVTGSPVSTPTSCRSLWTGQWEDGCAPEQLLQAAGAAGAAVELCTCGV
jgi:hypothetical protein